MCRSLLHLRNGLTLARGIHTAPQRRATSTLWAGKQCLQATSDCYLRHGLQQEDPFHIKEKRGEASLEGLLQDSRHKELYKVRA